MTPVSSRAVSLNAPFLPYRKPYPSQPRTCILEKSSTPVLLRLSCTYVKVDSVYTRSTPLMEVVKIGGRLDLVECLLAAGARLDVQVGKAETLFTGRLGSHNIS